MNIGKFKFAGPAEILHINARKTGDKDDKVLAVDIKLRAKCPAAKMGFFEPELIGALWLDSGAARNIMLGPIPFLHELEHYSAEFLGHRIGGCTVKKFAIEAKDGREMLLTFQVSFEPSADEVAKLAEFLQEEITIALSPENGDLIGG